MGKLLANVFYEPSTRTSCSFNAAMLRLGGQVIQVKASTSSVKKGETLQDTIRSLECYTDVTVLRHPEKSSVARVSAHCENPILNAGDGAGEHPTQALLDAYTIYRERSAMPEGLTITMVGDLKFGRTVHSLARLLTMFPNNNYQFISPGELAMPEYVTAVLDAAGVTYTSASELSEEVLGTSDVIYVTRIQKERFECQETYERLKGCYCVTPEVMAKAKADCVLMHPLPRVGEISEEVDSDPRAAYFRQMKNGMYIRMALIALVTGSN